VLEAGVELLEAGVELLEELAGVLVVEPVSGGVGPPLEVVVVTGDVVMGAAFTGALFGGPGVPPRIGNT
jgi:hypothetical protein